MNLILRPIISEKSMSEAAKGKFTFEVLKKADKKALKKEIEERFKVTVLDISTMIIKGKTQRGGQRRVEIKKPPIKKAVVKLKEGQKIDLFDVAPSQS